MSDDWDFSRPAPATPSFGGGAGGAGARPDPFGPPNSSDRSASNGPTSGGPSDVRPDPFGPPPGDPFAPHPGTPGAAPIAGDVGPPFVWLLVAALAALAALAVAALSLSGGAVYIAGWVAAGPLAVTLLTVFVRRDTSRQTELYYSYPTWKPLAYRAVLVLCLLAMVAVALRIGNWVGHL